MEQDTELDERFRADLHAIGALVRRQRQELRLSVEALAQQAGLSAGIVSTVERGRGNPSLSTLQKLSFALKLPLGQFLQGPRSSGMVVRPEARKRLLPTEGLVYELLTPDLNRSLEMLRIQIPPGFDNAKQPFLHPGEECVHLLSGRLQIFVGEQAHELSGGDTITYDPSLPHWYRNPTEEMAITLGVVTPPSF